MRTKHIIKIAVVLLTVAAVSMPVAAAPKPGAEGAISTVLVELRRDKDSFQDFWESQISPKMAQIGQSVAKRVKRATEIKTKLEKDPTSARLAASYEDELSAGLTETATFLREFQATKQQTMDAVGRVERTAEKAGTAYLEAAKASDAEANQFQSNADETRQKLEDMAKRLAPLLKKGQKLPVKINTAVTILAQDRKYALLNAKISQKAAENARQSATLLGNELLALGRVRGELEVAFAQADGQRALVTNLAKLRKENLLSQELAENLRAVNAISRVKANDVKCITNSLEAVVGQSLMNLRENVAGEGPSQTEGNQTGASILLQISAEMNQASGAKEHNKAQKPKETKPSVKDQKGEQNNEEQHAQK